MYRRTTRIAILAACSTVAMNIYADPEQTYLEDGGVVKFDVEDAQPVDGWTLKTDLEGFAGEGYLEWTGPNAFPKSLAGNGTITYHFRIATAGNYQLRLRSHIALGESSTEHNDSWVRLATGTNIPDEHPLNGWTKVYMNTQGSWTWASNTVDFEGLPVRQYFAAGDHTVEISGRSNGHAIDMIALYRYGDVNFNNGIANRWDLSEVVEGEGILVVPGEYPDPSDPDPDPVDPDPVDPDPVDPDPVDPEPEPEPEPEVENINLEEADVSWMDHGDNVCVADTLIIPAVDSKLVNPTEELTPYIIGDEIVTTADGAQALLKFDLSLVPPFTSLALAYSTGEEAGDGTLVYALGSHSRWTAYDLDQTNTDLPDAMLELARATGGLEADVRYVSQLSPTLLAGDINTITVSNTTGGDAIGIYGHTDEDLAPQLLLTGDANFCTDWTNNVEAANAPIEPEEPVEEILPPVEEPEPVDIERDTSDKDTTDAGSLSWTMQLIILLSALMRLIPPSRRSGSYQK